MILKEEVRDLLSVDEKYYLVHCIDRTVAMGVSPNGKEYKDMIAYQIEEKFHHKKKLKQILYDFTLLHYPRCIGLGRVFHLITKQNYYSLPSYISLRLSLQELKKDVEILKIKYLAMPLIGCGYDKLHWVKVKQLLEDIFKDTDVEILICRGK